MRRSGQKGSTARRSQYQQISAGFDELYHDFEPEKAAQSCSVSRLEADKNFEGFYEQGSCDQIFGVFEAGEAVFGGVFNYAELRVQGPAD